MPDDEVPVAVEGHRLRRRRTEPWGWGLNLGNVLLRPVLLATHSRTWIDNDKIPPAGEGCLLVVNHISHVDPLTTAHLVLDSGRLPRYLAKAGLFKNWFVRSVLRSAKQIPVKRLTRDAVGAYDAAVAAVQQGECVVVYPEGTLTRDPDLWPMRGKSGAARIALATGAPVIPVGHWGDHELLPPYATRPRLRPRAHVVYQVGDPVDLDDLREQEVTPAVVQQATDRIMAAIVSIVEELRGEKAPPVRFDPRQAGVKLIGNPNRKDRKR